MNRRSFRRCALLAAQLLLILLAVPILAFYPPSRGPMLLVPLSADARTAMVPLALAHGGRLIGRGRMPGSLVVWGRRGDLSVPLLGHGIVTLAIDAAACGRTKGAEA